MILRRSILTVAAILAAATGTVVRPARASACECAPPSSSYQEMFDEAAAVFTARGVESWDLAPDKFVAIAEVIDVYKGSVHAREALVTGPNDGSCGAGRGALMGAQVLYISERRDPLKPLAIWLCYGDGTGPNPVLSTEPHPPLAGDSPAVTKLLAERAATPVTPESVSPTSMTSAATTAQPPVEVAQSDGSDGFPGGRIGAAVGLVLCWGALLGPTTWKWAGRRRRVRDSG